MSKRLIWAEDAIDAVHNLYAIFGSEGEWVDRKDVFEAINSLPSAQPQWIRARWVQISPAKIYECSLCGKNVMTEDIDAYDFCHGCGADMRSEIAQ